MPSGQVRVSLADLASAGIRPRTAEAVAIIRDVALQVVRGELPGVPSAHVIRFTDVGDVIVEGPVSADGPDVSRAAHLLDTMLGGIDAEPCRYPSALRVIIAGALGPYDLSPYTSLSAFANALTRFAAANLPSVVRELCAAWSASIEAGTITAAESKPDVSHSLAGLTNQESADEARDDEALTISDIRRARRETSLTLAEVSERSRVPAWLLRELEWGYFRNWPAGLYGRTQLVRYARASGLDERLVVRTVWPMVEDAARWRGSSSVAHDDLQPAVPGVAHPAAVPFPTDAGRLRASAAQPTRRQSNRLTASAVIAALLILALLPVTSERWSRLPEDKNQGSGGGSVQVSQQAQTTGAAPTELAPAAVEPPGFAAVAAATFQPDDLAGVMRASYGDGTMLRVARVVDDGARNYHARMSPDGRWIAFDSDRDGDRGVYVADADGRHVRRVSGDGFAALPVWSPDGRTLLYVRAEDGLPDVWNLWTVRVGTGTRERLTSHESGQPWGGSWFPDGRRIAYSRGAKLAVLDTGTRREIEFPSPLPGRRILTPAVSPDGRRAIFQVVGSGAWLISMPGGATRRLLDDPSADGFSWAPDGRRFAYHSGRTGGWNVWVKLGSW
jgi:Helix-turn-helix domain/WD40-like Beta Propeller Repeat